MDMNYLKKYALILLSSLLAMACSDSNVQTSPASTQQRYSEAVIKAADISTDGQFSLLSDNQQICLWNNQSNKTQYPCLQGLEAQLIELVGISNSNRYFYTSNRINVHLYDLATGRLITVWSAGDNIINDIAMSEDESTLVFGFRSGQASIVSIKSNQITTFKPHRLDINSVSISAKGDKVLSGSSDKTAVLWQSKTGDAIHSFTHGSRVNHVSMSSDANVAFTLDAIKDRNFWLLKIGKKVADLNTSIKFIEFNDSVIANKNKWLLSASPKQKLQLWQVNSGDLLGEWQSFKVESRDRASVIDIQLIDNKTIATLTSDGMFELWPITTMPKN